jgi:hypothetical protein
LSHGFHALTPKNIRAQRGPGASRRLLHPKRAPPFRRDVAGDRLAGVRSDEEIAPVALFAVFGRRLIFYGVLGHFRFRAAVHQRQERRGPRSAKKNPPAADARWLASIAHLGLPSLRLRNTARASRPRRALSEPIHHRKVRLSVLLYFDLGQKFAPSTSRSSRAPTLPTCAGSRHQLVGRRTGRSATHDSSLRASGRFCHFATPARNDRYLRV